MAIAVALALAFPGVGAAGGVIPFDRMTEVGIGLVFFLHGANLSREALRAGAANWRLHAFVQASTFVLFPLLGILMFFGGAGFLPSDMRLGLFYLCAVSSTISSSVAMVGIAKGNVAAAVFDASLSGVIGMLVTPFLVALVWTGGADRLPVLKSVLDIAGKLLLPFLVGHLLRPLLARSLAAWKPWINRLDRGVIVLIVYTAFCNSTKEGVWSRSGLPTLLGVAALTFGLLLVVLFLTTAASRRLGFPVEDEITAVFCGSKKSLASGAPIAKVLFGASPALGAILLPLMVYHQLQLVVCSFVARRYAARGALADAPVGPAAATRIERGATS